VIVSTLLLVPPDIHDHENKAIVPTVVLLWAALEYETLDRKAGGGNRQSAQMHTALA
jgi:hypothetical protein